MTTERLQAAIAKARAQRDAGKPAAGAAVTAEPQPQPSGWDDLEKVSLDTDRLVKNRILSIASSRSSTPFDILRTRILQRMRENGWKRIAITSPTPRCGKSTLALNLAFGMSRQPDRQVISIEADMRRPSHETLLGLSRRDRSVARFLGGREPFSKSAVLARSNLALALNTHSASNASDVILGSTVEAALARLTKDYAPDLMIFDTPPLLANDDAMAFLTHVDCAMIVAAAGETTVKEIDQCERLIAQQTQVMGVVLNKARYGANKEGYEYY